MQIQHEGSAGVYLPFVKGGRRKAREAASAAGCRIILEAVLQYLLKWAAGVKFKARYQRTNNSRTKTHNSSTNPQNRKKYAIILKESIRFRAEKENNSIQKIKLL